VWSASIIYHDRCWYPFIGKKRVKEALKTKWGGPLCLHSIDTALLPGAFVLGAG